MMINSDETTTHNDEMMTEIKEWWLKSMNMQWMMKGLDECWLHSMNNQGFRWITKHFDVIMIEFNEWWKVSVK
jgi:hypothetical protein